MKFSAIRLAALDAAPYLGVAMWNITPVESPGLGTFACDRYWRVYWDPKQAEEWGIKASAGVLIHEVWHLLRNHSSRADHISLDYDKQTWNLAADCEINDDLRHDNILKEDIGIHPSDFNMPNNLTAEEYYGLLNNRRPKRGPCNCGSGSGGISVPGELGPPSSSPNDLEDESDKDPNQNGQRASEGLQRVQEKTQGLSETQAEVIRQQVANSVKQAGSVPDHVKRWAKTQLEPPKADPRVVLKAAISRAVAHVAGRVDYSWKRASRRHRRDIILPGMVKPIPKVAFVLDTSSSMNDDDLATEINFIDACLKRVGIKEVHTVVCDHAIHQARRITDTSQIQLQGGGSTSMTLGIEEAEKSRPDVIVVLTDGYTGWPSTAPKAATIIALVGQDTWNTAPKWARVIHL